MKQTTSTILLALLLFTCCSSPSSRSPEELAEYAQELNEWYAHRLEELTARDGWLNILGLYWLEPGVNTFGSSNENQIVFPDSTIESQAGYFLVNKGSVVMHLDKQTRATINGTSVAEQTIFNPDSTWQPQTENGKVAWTIIRRDGKFGVRVRDLTMRSLRTFQGIDRFPIDRGLRIDATFLPASSKTIDVTNVIGQTTSQVSPGTILFTLNGEEHRLDVLEGNDKAYFVIVADETSGRDTYAGGRYLYVPKEDDRKNIVLDFNKLYNPPCVFTPYATCPLPPRQNVLPFSIRAGEKVYGNDAHEE